ncbi:MAG TPA: VOC family protein [Acidobacteriaceae bacterium]|nr:VOC family protein [Acidobacteriaceae bacterium]
MISNGWRVLRCLALLAIVFTACERSPAQSTTLNPLHLTENHVTASVANLELEAAWYERVLGFHRSALLGGRKDFGLYQMTMPGNRIDLVWQMGSARHQQAKGRMEQGWLHVVFNTPDLKAAYQYLAAQGTDVAIERDAEHKIVHLTLHDPEGNEIGLVNE